MAKSEITVEGFVAKAPESRAAGNHTITTVAIPEEVGRMKDGQWVPDMDKDGNKIVVWWEAEFWNEHGDVVAASIGKGDAVIVRGTPRPRAFVKNDGTAGMSATIVNPTIGKTVRRPSRNAQQGSGGGFVAGAGQPSQDPWNAPQNGGSEPPQFGNGFGDEPF